MSKASTHYAIHTCRITAIGLLAMAAFAIRPVYAQMTCSKFGWPGKKYENANLVDANFQNVTNMTLIFANFRGKIWSARTSPALGLACRRTPANPPISPPPY
jgi:hypothetical protein